MSHQARSAMRPDDNPGQHLRRYRGPFLAPIYSADRMGMLTLLAEPTRTQQYLLLNFNLGGPWPAIYPHPFENHYDYWSPDVLLDRHGTLREFEFTRYAQLYQCKIPFPIHRALVRTDSIFHIPFRVERDTIATVHNATETCRIQASYFVRIASLSYSLWEAATRIIKIYKVLQLVPFVGLDISHTFGSRWRELFARFSYPLPMLDLVRIDAELRRRLADALSWIEFQILALVWSLAFMERMRPPRFPTLQERVGLVVEGDDHAGFTFGLELARDLGIPVWGCRAQGRKKLLVPGKGDVYADRAREEVRKRGVSEADPSAFQSFLQSEYACILQTAEDRGLARPIRDIPIISNPECYVGPGQYFRETPPDSVFEAKGIPHLLSLIGVMEAVLNKNSIPPHRPIIVGAEKVRKELYESLRDRLGPDVLSGTPRIKNELRDLPLWTKANAEVLLHGDPHILEADSYTNYINLLHWKPESDYDHLLLSRTPRPTDFESLRQIVNETPDAYSYLDSRFRLALRPPGRSTQSTSGISPFLSTPVRRSTDRPYKMSTSRTYSLPRQPLRIEAPDPLADSNPNSPPFQNAFDPNPELALSASFSSLDSLAPSNSPLVPNSDPSVEETHIIVARPSSPYEVSSASVPPGVPTLSRAFLDDPSNDFPNPKRLSLEATPNLPRRPSESPPTRNVRARLRSPSPPRQYIDLTNSPDSPVVERHDAPVSRFPLRPLSRTPFDTVESPRFVQAVKNDDVWFAKTFEAAWPTKPKGESSSETPGYLLQWGEMASSSAIGQILLRSFDASSCCLRDDEFVEYLCHRLPGLRGASLYFVTGPDDKSLLSFSVSLSFENRNSAVLAFRGLARAFARFPDRYPPVSIIHQEEVDRIPEGVLEKIRRRKEECDSERASLALKYTKGAKRLGLNWTRRVLGFFEEWVDVLPPNFRPWIHTNESLRQQGEYPRDGMPRWRTEAPSWPMTRYSFSPEEFDSALSYACRVLSITEPPLVDDARLCAQTIREHYAYTSFSVPAGLSVKLALPLPPIHALRKLLYFVAVHAPHVLILNPLPAMDEFHRVELLSYSPSRGTYDIILADHDSSMGYWDFVERDMDKFVEK